MTLDDINNALRDFIYNHTELAIWIGLIVLVIALFWMMVYSITVRRNLTIILVIAAVIVWAAFEYGYLEWPDTTTVERVPAEPSPAPAPAEQPETAPAEQPQ